MSGAKLQEEQVKGVYCHNMFNLSFASMLRQYRKLLLSAYGPKGSTILISNAVGRDTLAVSSVDITKQLSFSHPFAKYINALICAQNASCGLNGLYTGILCVKLIEETLGCEANTPHHVIADVSEWIITQLLTQMAQYPEQVVIKLDIGDMQQVSSFVKTILKSKGSLALNKTEMENMSLQIIKAFLRSIPQEDTPVSFGHLNISQEGSPGSDACVFDGLLYREPEIDPKFSQKISLLPRVIKVLLFAVSLSPEGETNTNVLWRGTQTKEEAFVNKTVFSLLSFFKDRNVHVLASQKVIHPCIKFEMERKGYIVLERLGTIPTDTLIKLSGCQAITNFRNLRQELNQAVLGKLSSIQHVSLSGKDYILLKQDGKNLCTLLLPQVRPTIKATLKEITQSCIAALRMAVVDGKVTAGGGCLETWLATQVGHLVSTNIGYLTSLTSVSSHHIVQVGNAFTRVFMELAIQVAGGSLSTKFDWCVDSVFHHLWHSEESLVKTKVPEESGSQQSHEALQTCVCGLLSQEVILQKYGGDWYPMDFQMSSKVTEDSFSESHHCCCETLTLVDKTEGDPSDQTSRLLSESATIEDQDFGIDADSLDEKVIIEEDVDSLERTLSSFEEEGDSLEGRLESLEDDVDSLEDILDKGIELLQFKSGPQKRLFDPQEREVLYDSYLAKYNALRLALEGFTQLYQVGQCVYDR